MNESNILSDSLLLKDIDPATAEACLSSFRRRKYAEGERIAEDGEECRYFLLIESGEAAIQNYTTGGDYSTIEILGCGDFFGEEAAEEQDAHYHYTLEALSDVVVFYISSERFRKLLQHSPQLLRNFVSMVLGRVRSRGERIVILSQKSVRQKIASYLLRIRKDQKAEDLLVLPSSREVTAKLLALPRPSLSRELKSMEETGLIELNGKHVRILNSAELEKLVEER